MRGGFKSLAFTLAEVLITLGIIGVVMEMTIPSVIDNFQRIVYATQLKKAYTIFNQALLQITNDYGCAGDLRCTGLFATNTHTKDLGSELARYFKIINNCGIEKGKGCFPPNTNNFFDGSSTSNQYDQWDKYYKFVTVDGTSFMLSDYADNGHAADCGTNWSNSGTGSMSQVCGDVIIDVNGLKGPNNLGKDTFSFYLTNGRGATLYPGGGMDDQQAGADQWWSTGDRCSTTNRLGYHCAGRIIEKNWTMDY